MYLVICSRPGTTACRVSRHRVEAGEVGVLVRDGLLVMGLPAVIVGGTLFGVFTATEAGGVAVIYAC